MYAASTTAASRVCADAGCGAGGPCASICVSSFLRLAGIALSFVRKYDDHRNKSLTIVVQ
jgi:hypothetical protein